MRENGGRRKVLVQMGFKLFLKSTNARPPTKNAGKMKNSQLTKQKHTSRKYLFFSHQIFRYRQNTGKKPCSVLMGLQSLNLSLESIGLGEQFLHSLKGSGGAKARFFFQNLFCSFSLPFLSCVFCFLSTYAEQRRSETETAHAYEEEPRKNSGQRRVMVRIRVREAMTWGPRGGMRPQE